MTDEYAKVLARDGNVAVVQLDGRAFPGLLVQGDTFAELLRRVTTATDQLRRGFGDLDGIDDLDDAVAEMTEILRSYELVLAGRGLRLPYLRQER